MKRSNVMALIIFFIFMFLSVFNNLYTALAFENSNAAAMAPGDIVSVSGGLGHSAALRADGRVYAWGYNNYGQVGTGSISESVRVPTLVPNLTDIVSISAGGNHTLALKQDGTVWAWGSNMSAQLGVNPIFDENSRTIPTKVLNLTGVIAISAGDQHSVALKSDGTVWTWGSNDYGQVGDYTEYARRIPVKIPGLTDVIAISAGNRHTLALKRDGTVWACGYNDFGSLGDGTLNNRTTPAQVLNLKDVIAISAGKDVSLALKKDGTVYAWGGFYNDFVRGAEKLTDIVAISAGEKHGIALKKDGTVLAWGNNGWGQLGNGDMPYKNTDGSDIPVKVYELTDAVSIDAGKTHNVVAKKDGTVWAWGNDGWGQLGDGADGDKPMPVKSIFSGTPGPVTYTDPSINNSNVPVNSAINIIFNKSVMLGNNYGGITVKAGNSSVEVKNIQDYDRIKITPVKNLAEGTTYTVTIPKDALTDKDGNLIIDNDFIYSFTTIGGNVDQGTPEIDYQRYAGSDRYTTSVNISRAGWTSSQYAVLATGEDFPDALSSAPLSKKYNAPILLTNPKILTPSVESQMVGLKVKTIFIIGGTGAVSQSIQDKLSTMGINFIRLSGRDRYETSAAIANYLGGKAEVVIATGDNFPDALSIASYAAFKGIPILLTQKESLPESTEKYLKTNNVVKTYVIGGPGVIGNKVFDSLPGGERLFGSDRYGTNVAVLNKFPKEFNMGKVYFATGEDFPDALSGSALAALEGSPIILTSSSPSTRTIQYISDNSIRIKEKYVLGGIGVVPDNTINKLLDVLKQ